ncbi:MAG: AAA family ATPase [bacterium]|nr:AAA family ATPase [bacterium]
MKTGFVADPNREESKEGEELSDADFEKVLKEYEGQLEFPDNKPERVFFVAIVGLIGTGKTTIMKEISRRLGLLRICTDDIRWMLFDKGYNFERTRELAGKVAFKYADAGYSIGFDSDAAGAFVLKNIDNILLRVPGPIVWLHVTASEKLILERLHESNPDRRYKGEIAVAHYQRRKALHENLTMPFLYTFDTSRDDVGSQLDEAERLIRKELRLE